MRIIFMGTPEFALPTLQAIKASRHQILAVVTGPDVARGRGQTVQETPVKQLALKFGLPVLQPVSLKDPTFWSQIKVFPADLYVVVAFRILPPELIAIPRLGAINLHASLLPKYRGAAPINWAIINGETETGVTVFQIKPQVDTGDILLQAKTPIDLKDTYGTVASRLSQTGARLVLEAIDGLEAGTLKGLSQDNALATPAPKIFPELGEIDWQKPATDLKNLIHGLSPNPGAFTFFKGKRLKILSATICGDDDFGAPGTIIACSKTELKIKTGRGVLMPLELQFEGRKPLVVTDFLRGFSGKVGEKFAL